MKVQRRLAAWDDDLGPNVKDPAKPDPEAAPRKLSPTVRWDEPRCVVPGNPCRAMGVCVTRFDRVRPLCHRDAIHHHGDRSIVSKEFMTRESQ
jgi:hypothetical protein